MSMTRLPIQAARDRAALSEYLRDLAAKVDRIEGDPYGVLVVFVGPESEQVGSRGIVYRHDYRRAYRAVSRTVFAHIEPGQEVES
jgi:hypothetical protein